MAELADLLPACIERLPLCFQFLEMGGLFSRRHVEKSHRSRLAASHGYQHAMDQGSRFPHKPVSVVEDSQIDKVSDYRKQNKSVKDFHCCLREEEGQTWPKSVKGGQELSRIVKNRQA